MQNIIESRVGVVLLGLAVALTGAVSVVLLGAPDAFAQAVADPGAVSAVTETTGTLEATIQAAVPLIAVVAIAWLILRFVKKLIAKAG